MSDIDEITLGVHAENILKNEAFKKCMSDMDAAYTAIWKDTGLKEVAEREAAYQAIQLLGDIQNQIEGYVQGKFLKEKELEKQARKTVNKNKMKVI